MTPAQLTVLKAAILAETDPEFVALREQGATGAMADWFNLPHASFVVWRTRVHEHEITRTTSAEGTNWSWTAYIGRSEAERDAWKRMFNSLLTIDASLPNVRAGIQDIFSGAGGSAQRTHVSAMCKRPATRAERLYANGTGTTASPGTMAFEGIIRNEDVVLALAG